MKKILAVLGLCAALASCQKEINIDLDGSRGGTGSGGSGGGGSTGGSAGSRLVKIVAVTGSDTLKTVYTYDSQSRMATSTEDGPSGGIVVHDFRRFERDAAGRVVRVAQYLEQNGVAGDTTFTVYHYPDATTMQFDYSIMTMSFFGLTNTDSSAFTYSGSKMTGYKDYMSNSLTFPTPTLTSQTDFTNDASGHVTQLKIYNSTVPGTPVSLTVTESFTYGPTLDPNWLSASAAQNYITNGAPNTATDAMIKMDVVSPAQPLANMTVNITYTGAAGGRPSGATIVSTGAQPSTTKHTYYYQ